MTADALLDRLGRLPVGRLVSPARRRWLLKLLQRRARRYGYSLVPAPPPTAGVAQWDIWTWVRATSTIRTVVDIGANDGVYARYLNEFFRPAAVHAFEPLPGCQPKLAALKREMPNVTLHQLALSDRAGEATFYSNEYAPASSLLEVSAVSRRAFPETERATATAVQVARLDDVLPADSLERDILVKIDVQGVEDRVIRGGRALFSAASVVLIEMAFVAVYENQPLFEEVHTLLAGCGLRLAGFKNQIDDAESGQPLFAHCLYRRPDHRTPD
ncbi:MAG: FkbM family methyltransferase [Chloroflexi bacterium]|nr:FkbM family methyltransferase [Chloroflexota bacterium]